MSESNSEKQLFQKATHRPEGSCYEKRGSGEPKVAGVSGSGFFSKSGCRADLVSGLTEARRPQQTRPGVGGSNWVWELVHWGGAEPAASGHPEAEARGRQVAAGSAGRQKSDA